MESERVMSESAGAAASTQAELLGPEAAEAAPRRAGLPATSRPFGPLALQQMGLSPSCREM